MRANPEFPALRHAGQGKALWSGSRGIARPRPIVIATGRLSACIFLRPIKCVLPLNRVSCRCIAYDQVYCQAWLIQLVGVLRNKIPDGEWTDGGAKAPAEHD
jgi:hypothetical protein